MAITGPTEAETYAFYRSLPAEMLPRLRAAFVADAVLSGDDAVAAFCYRRVAIIDRVLRDRGSVTEPGIVPRC